MPESAPMPTFTVGRLVSWVIIALMAAASAYATAISVINWDQITV